MQADPRMETRSARTIIWSMYGGTLSLSELSDPQRTFAERAGATPQVLCSSLAVCLYRESETVTYRWIVAVDGAVVDEASFAHAR